MTTINFNVFSPFLETGKHLTKPEFLRLVKPALNTRKEFGRRLAELIGQLQFFEVVKTPAGVIVN